MIENSFENVTLILLFKVFPTVKCKLRLLKLERIKDYLLMEQEFIQNQEIRRPREEQNDVSYTYISFYLLFSHYYQNT